jgi:hypothetical protein
LDLRAIISPGLSAAGLAIGDPIPEIPPDKERNLVFISGQEMTESTYGPVIILSQHDRIAEISLTEGFEGRTEKGIGIGSTLGEVETLYGEVKLEDSEELFFTPSTPGWCFDTRGTHWEARIERIDVYKTEGGKITRYVFYSA